MPITKLALIEAYAQEQIHNLTQHVGKAAVELTRFRVSHDIAVVLTDNKRGRILGKYEWREDEGMLCGYPWATTGAVMMEAVVEFRHRTQFNLRGL